VILLPLQVLRAIAATAVVVGHFQNFTATPATHYWIPYDKLAATGVDLFFVISGFVMVYASESLFGRAGGPRDFAMRRVIRIVPLYWLATSIYLMLAVALPSLGVRYSPQFIASSYFFIPAERPDGGLNPIVGQGWTLNLEMLFYAIFACTLIASRVVSVSAASLVLIAMVAIGHFFPPSSTILAFWTSPLLLEFVMGMMVGLAFSATRHWPRWMNGALIAAAIALLYVSWFLVDLHRVVGHGIPAALLVAGATYGGYAPDGAGWRALAIGGDGSYALYLFHAFPIHAMLKVFALTGIVVELNRTFCLVSTVVLAILMAIAIYYMFERPVTRALRAMASQAHIARPARAGSNAVE
jgi:peptidoglycan/LPS O-acetylase OafA/YrhL